MKKARLKSVMEVDYVHFSSYLFGSDYLCGHIKIAVKLAFKTHLHKYFYRNTKSLWYQNYD